MSDLIERQAAIDAIDYYIAHKKDARKKHSALFVDGMEDGYFRIRSMILNLPSAQPEPSQVAREIATILENEQDMRVILKNADLDDIYAHAETEA